MEGTARAPARSVAVVRALPGLGDWLCAVPAMRALRTACPEARVTLVGLSSAAGIVAPFRRYVDELLPFPGHTGIPEAAITPGAREAFESEARSRHFDLAIQMHGNGSAMNGFLQLLHARRLLAYRMPCAPAAAGLVPYVTGLPEVSRWTGLVSRLGIPVEDRLEYPLAGDDVAEAAGLLAASGVRRPYAVVHPGASSADRRWDAAGFARVTELLAEERLDVVLTGSEGERADCREVSARARERTVDTCGATSVGSLAAVLAGARVVVCNDTGVAHLAAAVEAPSTVVFTGSSDPRRWAIRGRKHLHVLPPGYEPPADDAAPAACGFGPCPILAERPRPPHPVPIEDVLAATRRLLGNGSTRRSPYVA